MPAGFWRVRAESGARRRTDAAEITRALGVLADPAAGVQIQALQDSLHWRHFRGDEHAAIAHAAATIGREEDIGVYLTLNPFPAGCDHCVKNDDVTARRWLMVDCDSVKPPHANATDTEKDCARALALAVMDFLTDQGWPQPVGIDSGNGWHLLYRVELDNVPLSKLLCKDVLKALAKRFDVPGAVVDKETYQAKQQTKLPGTEVRKGPVQEGRPTRMARLAFEPDLKVPVPVELLEALAAEVRKAEPPPRPRRSPWYVTASGNDVSAYCKAALKNEFARLVTAPVGERNATLTSAAFSLGTLVQPGWLLRQDAEQELMLACHVLGVMDTEEWKCLDTIRRQLDEGAKHPRQLPGFDRPSANGATPYAEIPDPDAGSEGRAESPAANGHGSLWTFTFDGEVLAEGEPTRFMAEALKLSSRAEPTEFEAMTLPNLMSAELPPPNWCIPGLLAEGLNLLAGAPKSGKSMLSLNLAFAVAGGGRALGTIQAAPGDVLYLSLEDKLRRIQARSRRMIVAYGEAGLSRLAVVTTWPRMDLGGLVMLREWVRRVERPTLVIIDVLGKFRPPSRSKGSQYEEDSQHLYEIKRFADDNNLTALVNHHTRKGRGKDESEDPFETISGTLGIGGACDGILLLKRPRGQDTAVLSVTGRDDAEQRLALQFTAESLTWASLGSADEHLTGQLQVQVLEYLKQCQPHPVFPRDIADHLKHEDTARVRTTCHRLFDRGLIRKHGNAWAYPGPNEIGGEEAF